VYLYQLATQVDRRQVHPSYTFQPDSNRRPDLRLSKTPKRLTDALLRLRSTDEACLVWADAICIDQSNVVEHGQQVRLMQSIYASATITIVNLGEPGEKGARAIALGTHIIELSKILPPNYRASVANLESFGLPPDGSAAWNPLNEFFQNPWFQRAWIAQEFAVSPRLAMTYGDQTLLADFAGKVRTAFLRHGLGHYLMSGNPTSEKDRLKAAKQWTRIGWLHKLRSSL
jgi:hypothetical protein